AGGLSQQHRRALEHLAVPLSQSRPRLWSGAGRTASGAGAARRMSRITRCAGLRVCRGNGQPHVSPVSERRPAGLVMAAAPDSICLLRLSALGDCANIVPIVHTLQRHWPQTRLSWVINRSEAELVGDLPGVEFVVMDKKAGRAGLNALRQQMHNSHSDVLLHMHASWRANRVSLLIRADRRIG